jgi:hypothetical protein
MGNGRNQLIGLININLACKKYTAGSQYRAWCRRRPSFSAPFSPSTVTLGEARIGSEKVRIGRGEEPELATLLRNSRIGPFYLALEVTSLGY